MYFRQDARFGDSFWSEDHFLNYLIRLLSSWAVVYDVIYLPVEHKNPKETNDEFAARVQRQIAEAAQIQITKFDGGFFYKRETERQRHFQDIRAQIASKLLLHGAFQEKLNKNNNKFNGKGNGSFFYRSDSYTSQDLLL